jgi:hypothetical protein
MFKLKLWFQVILVAVVGTMLFILGTPSATSILLEPSEREVGSLKHALDGVLQKRASAAVDAAAMRSLDPGVQAALDKAANPTPAPAPAPAPAPKEGEAPQDQAAAPATAGDLRGPEVEKGDLGKAAFAVLVDATGAVAGQSGEVKGLDKNLSGLPLVADALRGIRRDGFFLGEETPYLTAASPIYKDAKLAGAIVLGWPYDLDLLDKISGEIDSPTVMVVGPKMVGPEIKGVTTKDLYVGAGVQVVPNERRAFILVTVDRTTGLNAIASFQASIIFVTLALAFLMAVMLFNVSSSISKPLNVIIDHLSRYQTQGSSVGILPEAALRGPFARVGKQLNMILSSGPGMGGGMLDSISGESSGPSLASPPPPAPMEAPPEEEPVLDPEPLSPGESLDPGLPPMGADPMAISSPSNPGIAPLPGADAPPADDAILSTGSFETVDGQGLLTGAGDDAGADSGIGGLLGEMNDNPGDSSAIAGIFDDNFSPPPAEAAPPPAAAPPPPAAEPPPPMMPDHEATAMFQVPEELLQQGGLSSPGGSPFASPPPAAAPGADRTVVAAVPQDLIKASAATPDLPPEEQAHFQEVFNSFVSTRQQCGEDTADLTYERFVQKLIKNRTPIIEKYKCRSVRFQVYVKAGKAALRAVPVRD